MLQTRIMELMVTPQLPTYKKKGSNENLTMWSRSLRHYPFIYIYIYSIYVYHSFLSLAQGLICLFYKITNQTYLPQSVTRDYKLFVQLTARQECNQIRQGILISFIWPNISIWWMFNLGGKSLNGFGFCCQINLSRFLILKGDFQYLG
jgi:hypothetical protein